MMAIPAEELRFPSLPAKHSDFLSYVAAHPQSPMPELLQPFKQYDAELRKAFAQQPDHAAIQTPNILSIFAGHESSIKTRARNIDAESQKETESYIMPLKMADRKQDGSPAIVESLSKFKEQFSLFSENALSDLDWSNVVAAGSSVVTPLLPVPSKHATSKRALRNYYHEIFAPASDVDLFLYDLTEEQAIEKIRTIERNIKDALLCETTTIRTKNAITIASQYPTRHIQIVLRVYKSVSEILTGFDVDCSCAAFDGQNVWANPRAVAAFMTQTNHIDLTRRSPSYESRLSKYNKRGFEIYWSNLDRSRIDPTIFERSFMRTEGLARLLVLEKLPTDSDRERYNDQRRRERGRPSINRYRRHRHKLAGDVKAQYEDEVAEWDDAEETASSYHTFSVPYGPKYHAAKLEKLLFTKDLLLNAEWNKPKDREVHLHRHPAFFGDVADVLGDCCGSCPQPTSLEEQEVYEKESKIYVSGKLSFIKDDAGRQAIGSFNPLSPEDYTSMAYVGNTEMLCHAIVDGDVAFVQSWLEQDGNDPNTRDFTGRTPLILAVMHSTVDIVQLLIDAGARLVARLVDGKTALHIACQQGDLAMVKALLIKSTANEEDEEAKIDAKRAAWTANSARQPDSETTTSEDSDMEMIDEDEGKTDIDVTTEASMVNIKSLSLEGGTDEALEDSKDEPDIYDINVTAWDTAVSPLHLAITRGHTEVVKCLVQEFGADVLLPVKLFQEHDARSARASLLTLVLALQLPRDKAEQMTELLFELGATASQADVQSRTAFHAMTLQIPDLIDTYNNADPTGVKRSLNHIATWGGSWSPTVKTAFISAIEASDSATALKLLTLGSKASISYSAYAKASGHIGLHHVNTGNDDFHKKTFEQQFRQPIMLAVEHELPEVAIAMIREHGVDINTMSTEGYNVLHNEYNRRFQTGMTLLDVVRAKLKTLREWTPYHEDDKPPEVLKDDAFYLGQYASNSYEYFQATEQLTEAKRLTKERWDQHVESAKRLRERKGLEQKQAAIYEMMNKFRQLEDLLLKHKAKSFYGLHPTIETPEEVQDNNSYGYVHHGSSRYEFKGIRFQFKQSMTDDQRAAYVKLFNACWRGDLEAVKHHVLSPWKDSDDQMHPPLAVAVADPDSLSPISIAILRGHKDLARTLIDIAAEQYTAHIEVDKRQHTRLRGQGDNEDYSSGDDSDIQLETETVDDTFTHNDVGNIPLVATSTVSVSSILSWDLYKAHKLVQRPRQQAMSNKRTATGSIKDLKNMIEQPTNKLQKPRNLIQTAIWLQDLPLLTWLLELVHEFHNARRMTDDDDKRPFELPPADFKYALAADEPAIVAMLIRSTGAGIPLQHWVQKSGMDREDKAASKYYQGLHVRGSRKKEWAMRGHNQYSHPTIVAEKYPPLLECVRFAALENVEWFLSDAPLRAYDDFATGHAEDRRLQILQQAKINFASKVKQFLLQNHELAVHIALMAEPSEASLGMLKFLIAEFPDSINLRSRNDGLTPLMIAFTLYREEEAKLLIAAGADQSVRDKKGRNLMHALLEGHWDAQHLAKQATLMTRMINLVDNQLLKSMFLERTTATEGTQTPLALFLNTRCRSENQEDICRLLLKCSNGAELTFIDGKGETPLHTALSHASIEVITMIIDQQAGLIFREGAVGRTPYEVVEDGVLASRFQLGSNWSPVDHDFSDRRVQTVAYNTWLKTPLATRDSEEFVRAWSGAEKSFLQQKWDLMQSVKADLVKQAIAKRTLVSLNEANEVARRLAAQQQVSISGDYDARDQVHLWIGDAKISTDV